MLHANISRCFVSDLKQRESPQIPDLHTAQRRPRHQHTDLVQRLVPAHTHTRAHTPSISHSEVYAPEPVTMKLFQVTDQRYCCAWDRNSLGKYRSSIWRKRKQAQYHGTSCISDNMQWGGWGPPTRPWLMKYSAK